MGKYLIVGDVDHIQDYVFASSRLRAIRGASALLDTIAEHIKQHPPEPLNSHDILRWRGGQIVAVLPDAGEEQAEIVCASMERTFRERSGCEATITIAWQTYQEGGFRQAIKNALRKVQDEKDGRQCLGSQGQAFLTSPYHRRCHLLPSQSATEPDERRERYLSRAALIRWNAVNQQAPSDRDLRCKFSEEGIASGTMPYNLDNLWEGGSEGRYMAFVMADGNGFGQLLGAIRDPESYEAFSQELHDLTITAVVKAADKAGIESFSGKGGQEILPMIPIILGGDDMSILVAAKYAVPFTYYLCHIFSRLSAEISPDGRSYRYPYVHKAICDFREGSEAGEIYFPGADESQWRLTLSTGMVIAKKAFPISAFRRFASELRSAAKTKLRSQSGAALQGGAIDFAVITTSTVQSHSDILQHYRFDETPETDITGSKIFTCLTGRPYSVDQFGNLRILAKELRAIPRSKRKFLYQEFFKGRARATEAYQFVMAREGDRAENIANCLEQKFDIDDPELSPFRDTGMELETPLLDALELAELE